MLLNQIGFNIQRKVNFSAACFAFSVNHYDKFLPSAGWHALHYAARYGSIEIIQLIFGRVHSPDPLNIDEVTPLCLACGWNSPDAGKPKFEDLTFTRWPYRNTFMFPLHFRCPWKTEKKKKAP